MYWDGMGCTNKALRVGIGEIMNLLSYGIMYGYIFCKCINLIVLHLEIHVQLF